VSQSGGRRRKVMVMIDSLAEIGGAETLALHLAERLDPERDERILCVTRWDDEVAGREPARSAVRRLDEAGVRVLGIERRSRASLGAWRKLVRFLRAEDVDVIHAHKFGSNVWAVLFGRLARVPAIVAHEHMWNYESSGRARHWLDRVWIARGADALIAVSEEGRRQMIELEGVRPQDVLYIRNGVPDVGAGDPGKLRAELGIGPGEPVIGTVAQLRPEKALEVLVEAAALLRERRPGLHVLIAGEGDERPGLEELIRARGLEGAVHLLGYRADVPNVLAALDVAVCCSDFEGGPLSVMEYMGAALPIVATDVGGLPELVRPGETGALVPPRDPRALADAAEALLDDPEQRRELGERARALRRAEYSLEVWVERMEALYDELLPSRSD
jgi:glycosyltransferase involved in cell wall biosynthesis